MTTPAGWYPDPSRAPGQRYFDGARWTEQRTQAPAAAKRTNTIGIVALIASIIGFIFACVPGALVVGWVLPPAAFVLGIVGLFLTGKARGTSIAAVIVSMIGTVVGVVVFFTVVSDAFKQSFHKSDLSASFTGTRPIGFFAAVWRRVANRAARLAVGRTHSPSVRR